MQAAHLPPIVLGETPQYLFPDKPAAPDDIQVTSDLYPLPGLDENAKAAICYTIRVDTTAFTRGELTWPETLNHERYHVHGGPILGHDFVGTVETVHHVPSQVPKFMPGDQVWGLLDFDRNGAAAEYTMALEDELDMAPSCPKGMSIDAWNQELATIPLSGLTAFQALFIHANLSIPSFHPSETINQTKSVLVTGASGSVGVFVVQLAKAAGLKVIALCGTKGAPFVEHELKPDVTLDYQNEDFLGISGELNKRRIAAIDVLIDCVGGATFKELLLNEDVMRPSGKIVSIAGPLSDFPSETVQKLEESCRQRKLDFSYFIVKPNSGQLSLLGRLVSEKRFRGYVDAVYPLEDARSAMHRVEGNGTKKGKVVLQVCHKDT